jgi:hypothetical protein
MVRSSVSPDNLSQVSAVPSFTGTSTTPELLEEEEVVAEEKMQGNYISPLTLHLYKLSISITYKGHIYICSKCDNVVLLTLTHSLPPRA